MKNHKSLFFILSLVFLMCAVQALQANTEIAAFKQLKNFEDKIETLPGKTLYIQNTHADIIIIGTDSNEIKVKASLEVSASSKD